MRCCTKVIFLSFILCLFAINCAKTTDPIVEPLPITGTESISGTVALMNGNVSINVYYDSGYRQWADYQLAAAQTYLPAAETYLNAALPKENSFNICGQEQVIIWGREYGGQNTWDEILLKYDESPIGSLSIPYHELTHYWFPATNICWLYEGIVSFLSYEMIDSGDLILTDDEADSILPYWGFYNVDYYDSDDPLITDFRNSGSYVQQSFYYQKSFKVQYILFKELGASGYQSFIRQLYSQAPLADENDVITLLNSIKVIDWNSFLTGWVFSGAYTTIAYDDFDDIDFDGLLSVDEIYLGTQKDNPDSDNDLIPDGEELELGLDPTVSNSSAYVETYGPFVDGLLGDWSYISNASLTDSSGDQTNAGSEYDFVNLNYVMRSNMLYFAAETAAAPLRVSNVIFDVLIDTDFDYYTDIEYFFILDGSGAWTYTTATGENDTVEGHAGAANDNRRPGLGYFLAQQCHRLFQFRPAGG